jgi:hypothetical protein
MKPREILKARKEKADKIAMALGCPWGEAYQIVLDDEEVDKMTSLKEIENNLTEEQKKVSKEMRSTTSGKKQTRRPRSVVIDVNKRDIFNAIQQTLADNFATPLVVTTDKELTVHYGGKDYKVTISTPRTKKEEA